MDDEKAALCRCADRLASAAADSAAWSGCVALLEASLPLSAPAAAAERTVALAKALLKEASANSGKSTDLLRRVQDLRLTGIAADPDSPAAKALAFCQAEAICISQSQFAGAVSRRMLVAFGRIVAAGPQARLRLAQAGLQAGHPALASGLLLGYLRQASGDPLQEAAARREVVFLAQRGGSGVEVLRGFCAETLSRQHWLNERQDEAPPVPTPELLWLATTAWNEGVRMLQSKAEGDAKNAAQTFLSQARKHIAA
ncbi:hypothetical protein AK812_SmicGene36116 [Symbiodinium microadriaticum]|uniref:Uncharacterized protein n=1 Tax=Symbiodinium microadriaticum TaxID=2951 RepID=A0A1Q9CJR9_SYMMI|nr:hypothetical protein AK812_SmicGene36116 [Symbiodinium microadriaticum]